jgi:hypothetical protein
MSQPTRNVLSSGCEQGSDITLNVLISSHAGVG